MEPMLIHYDKHETKPFVWHITIVWFFREMNIVCKEAIILKPPGYLNSITTTGGTEEQRAMVREFLGNYHNEFREVA